MGGCGSGSDESKSNGVVIGPHSAQFVMGLGGVTSQGSSSWTDGIRLTSEDSNGRDYSGVFPLPADENLVVGNVIVENGTGAIMANVAATITAISPDWEALGMDLGGGNTGWTYGAIAAGTEGAPVPSSPQRWVFQWTGADVPAAGTFTVLVTWTEPGAMPSPGAGTSIVLNTTSGPAGVTPIYADVTGSTSATTTDLFDGNSVDQLLPPPAPGDSSSIAFPHPEYSNIGGDLYVTDARALLYPGQMKSWDYAFTATKKGAFTFEVDASGVPAGYSWVKVINLQTGAEMTSLLPGETKSFGYTTAIKNTDYFFQVQLFYPAS
jgi:hypothetical protein